MSIFQREGFESCKIGEVEEAIEGARPLKVSFFTEKDDGSYLEFCHFCEVVSNGFEGDREFDSEESSEDSEADQEYISDDLEAGQDVRWD